MTDVVMPEMNGREVARRRSALHPEARILFASGYAEDVIFGHGAADTELAFIAKPYSMQGLARKIRDLLGSPSG